MALSDLIWPMGHCRFKNIDFGIAGVIALVHDVLVALGALAITGRQIDLLSVTAFLTIAGYSINGNG